MVYGSTLQVPGDLLKSSPEGVAEADYTTILDKLRTSAAKPSTSTTGLHDRTIHWPKAAATTTHVYVKKGHVTPLGPIKDGPFPIVERLQKSTLKLLVAHYANGQPRYENHHWENCQPAAMADDAESAQRPALGRRPATASGTPPLTEPPLRPPDTPRASAEPPPAQETVPSTTTAPDQITPTPLPEPPSAAEEAPTVEPPRTTRSGRQVKSTKRSEFDYQ